MKKEAIFSLIGLILVFSIIVYSLNNFNKLNNNNNQLKNNQINQKEKKTKDNLSPKKTISLEEVKKHNQPNDCWLIIDNKVYNVTDFNNHPGGRIAIENYCGQDATNAFQTKGFKNQPHSQKAKNLLENFYLGDLDENK